MNQTIGMLMFDDLEELDLVGPWEVFTMAVIDLPGSHYRTDIGLKAERDEIRVGG